MFCLYNRCHTEATAQEAVLRVPPSCRVWGDQVVLAGALHCLCLGQEGVAEALLLPTTPRHWAQGPRTHLPLCLDFFPKFRRQYLKQITFEPNLMQDYKKINKNTMARLMFHRFTGLLGLSGV